MIEHDEFVVRGRAEPDSLRDLHRGMAFLCSLGPVMEVLLLGTYISRGQIVFVYLTLLFFLVTLPYEIVCIPHLFQKAEEVTAGEGRIRVTRPGVLFSRPLDFTLARDRIGRCVYRRNPISATFRFIDTDGRLRSPRVTTVLTRSELEEIFSNVGLSIEVAWTH